MRVEGKSDLLKLDVASWREMLSGTNDFLQALKCESVALGKKIAALGTKSSGFP